MTYFEAQEIIDNEQKQSYYSTSPLNTGEVAILRVGEDGFSTHGKRSICEH